MQLLVDLEEILIYLSCRFVELRGKQTAPEQKRTAVGVPPILAIYVTQAYTIPNLNQRIKTVRGYT